MSINHLRLLCVSIAIYSLSVAVGAQTTASKSQLVKIETTMGTIKVRLYDETPQHKANFIKLVQEGFYDNLLFHRVIKDFMIQGGDPLSLNADSTVQLGGGGLDYTIPAEINFPEYYHKRGALAAARLGDATNPTRASSACQFYLVQGKCYTDAELTDMEHRINLVLRSTTPFKYSEAQRRQYKTFGGSPHLDAQYTVFGEIVEGFDVLSRISAVEVGKADRPREDVRILRVKLVKR